jgi:glycosyltransferase involved in cell wall biosynthesis
MIEVRRRRAARLLSKPRVTNPRPNRRKILLVSYLFPPNGGIAVQRALSFAKYLPPLGYEVHVLKARNASGPVQDPGLLKHIPPQVRIHEAFTPEIPFHFRQKIWSLLSRKKPASSADKTPTPAGASRPSLPARLIRRILCPEPEILWVPFAVRKLAKIIERENIDTVLVTVPPFSALVVGTHIKRRFPHIRLISDFRDEWLSFYLKDFDFQNSAETRRRAETIERESIEASDLVIAVTPTSLQTIRDRYPDQPDSKFACLPNGYDPESFASFRAREHSGAQVVVTHMGTLYKTASPRYYLDALDTLPDEIRSRFETRFVGRIADSERSVLEGRKSDIRILGFMPQTEALRQTEETDFLLLTMTNEISLPGKLFEYLATGKPILALAAAGSEVHQILAETGSGWCADPFDPAAIQAMLRKAVQYREQAASNIQWDKVRRYERPRLTAELAGLIEERT